jgi:hypothetical protein
MTVLERGDEERASCPGCGVLLRHVDIFTAGALRDTYRGTLPTHLRAVRASEEISSGPVGRSSKISALLQVRAAQPGPLCLHALMASLTRA